MEGAKKYQGWTILVDADGTLTDGKKHVNEKGERVSISFHARDSVACKMLVEMGFQVIIVTHSRFTGIPSYWNRYGAQIFWAAKGDAMINKIDVTSFYTIDWQKTIGIGDDITDLCYLEKCKFAYTIADPHPFYRSKDLELWLGRSVHLSKKVGEPKRLPCNGGEGVLAYIYQLVKLGVYAGQ
jgi:3-deoxy-D-manno-octulosonate 8-phosphate phosphatase KdsC-like HAD superfamily phosphatase